MKKKVFLKVLVAAIVLAVISQGVHTLAAYAEMKYYVDPKYFPVWSKLMMPTAGPPPMSFMVYSFVFGLIGWLLFTLGYLVVGKSMPGKTLVKKGLMYGLFIFLVGCFPGYLSMYLLINLPAALIVMWVLESLVIGLIGGAIVARVFK